MTHIIAMTKKRLQNSYNFKQRFFSRETLQQIGYALVLLFSLAMFFGKAATNITGAALFVVWVYYTICFNRDFLSTHPYLKWFLFPVGAGLFLGFFSTAGPLNSLQYLNHFKFMLLPLPLAAFITRPSQINQALLTIAVSAIISIGYGVLALAVSAMISFGHGVLTMEGNLFGVALGFQKLGRCADSLMVMNLVLFTFIFLKKKDRPGFPLYVRRILPVLLIFFMWVMVMTGIRGAWIGFIVGMIIFLFFFQRRLIPVLLLVTLVSIPIFNHFNQNVYLKVKTDFYSITRVFTETPKKKKQRPHELVNQTDSISSSPYGSNSTRRHIFKSGVDFAKEHFFFGTGVNNTKTLFLEFFSDKPQAYQKQFYRAKNHPKDFHNSYLQLIIETGIFTTILFLFSLGALMTKLMQTLGHCKAPEKPYILASLVGCLGFSVAQFVHTELFSYGGKIFFFTLFMGCFFMETSHAKQ